VLRAKGRGASQAFGYPSLKNNNNLKNKEIYKILYQNLKLF
jgi:hypothetical protein